MPARTSPPFRADHVGSLLRPPELLRRARTRRRPDRRRDCAPPRTTRSARSSAAAGGRPGSATDGEFRRESWHMDFIYQLDGVTQAHGRDDPRAVPQRGGRGSSARRRRCTSTRRIGCERRSSARPSRSCATRRRGTPKLTIPSPSMVHYRGGRASIDESVYPDLDEFWADLTSAYASEIAAPGELGCTLSPARRHEPRVPQRPRSSASTSPRSAVTPSTSTRRTSRNINARSPAGPRAWRSPRTCAAATTTRSWVAEGGYDFVAEALFNELEVDGFFMEWDDERSGGFEPLRFVPKGKVVVLGLVTTKRGELEPRTTLKRRIEEAVAVRRPRPALPVAAVRLLLDRGGQRRSRTTSRWPSCALVVEIAAEVWGE